MSIDNFSKLEQVVLFVLEPFRDFEGALDDGSGQAGQPGRVEAVRLGARAGRDGVQEDDRFFVEFGNVFLLKDKFHLIF